MSERQVGKVAWFNNGKGYGFIKPDEAGAEDVFVHYSKIESQATYKTLRKDDRVSFRIDDGQGGREAFEVRLV